MIENLNNTLLWKENRTILNLEKNHNVRRVDLRRKYTVIVTIYPVLVDF